MKPLYSKAPMAEITVPKLDESIRNPKMVDKDGKALKGDTRRIKAGDRLYLEVRKALSAAPQASWVLRYTHHGRKQSLGLGKYHPQGFAEAGGVTLAQARKAAKVKLLDVDAGIQPVKAARATAKKQASEIAAQVALETRTVRAAVHGWHEATKGGLTSPKYAAQRLRRLEEFLPHIGITPVALLTSADVSKALKELMQEGKNAKRRANRTETLRRSAADLEKALDYAMNTLDWFDSENPATRALKGIADVVGKKPPQVGHRAFKVERLAEFSKALHSGGAGLPYPVTAHLLHLLALTGARTREVRELKWSEVEGLDGDRPMLHIPASRMKRRAPWSMPLSRQAVKLLTEIRGWQARAGGGLKGVKEGYVFTRLDGNYKGRLCSENSVNDLLKVMGWHGELVGHGLRKVFSTVAHASWPYLGANRTEAIEFSLAHVHKDRVRGIYDSNGYMDQRRALMQWWADHLECVRQPQASNVLRMRSGQR